MIFYLIVIGSVSYIIGLLLNLLLVTKFINLNYTEILMKGIFLPTKDISLLNFLNFMTIDAA